MTEKETYNIWREVKGSDKITSGTIQNDTAKDVSGDLVSSSKQLPVTPSKTEKIDDDIFNCIEIDENGDWQYTDEYKQYKENRKKEREYLITEDANGSRTMAKIVDDQKILLNKEKYALQPYQFFMSQAEVGDITGAGVIVFIGKKSACDLYMKGSRLAASARPDEKERIENRIKTFSDLLTKSK